MNKMNRCHKANPEQRKINDISVANTVISVQHSNRNKHLSHNFQNMKISKVISQIFFYYYYWMVYVKDLTVCLLFSKKYISQK